MKNKLIAVYLLSIFLSACGAHTSIQSSATPTPAKAVFAHQTRDVQFTRRVREQKISQCLLLINKYRRQKGLRSLALDLKLAKAAQWMSEDMAKNNYLGHTDSLRRDPFKRLHEFSYSYNTYKAENVAAGQSTAAEVLASWQNSPPHNANLLNANFIVIGIGLAYNPKTEFGWYWATNFGGQKSKLKPLEKSL